MTIRIKFAVKDSAKGVSRADNSVEVILADNTQIQDEDNHKGINLFHDAFNVNTYVDEVEKLKIVCQNEKEARKVYDLLHLKHKIKGSNPWEFSINDIKANTTPALKMSFVDDTLTLKVVDFSNGLNSIDISNVSFNEGFHPFVPDGYLTSYKNELFALEDLLNDLETNFQSSSANIRNLASQLSQLLAYSSGGDSIKQHLFDLRESPGSTGIMGFGAYPHIFRPRINKFIEPLREFAVWSSPEIGFTSMEQILKANANGFIFSERKSVRSSVTIGQESADTKGQLAYETGKEYLQPGTPNVNAIKNILRGGRYKGFSIIDPAQASPVKSSTGYIKGDSSIKVLFGWKCEAGAYQYTKTHIDMFRKFLSVNMEVESEEAEKRKCFGFEITDVINGYYQNLSGGNASPKKTKIVYDILMAPDLDSAIDLAFFGRPYPGMHNVDSSLLFLNEVDDKSRKEILDIYFEEGLKSSDCGRTYLFRPFLKNDWQINSYKNNNDSENKVNKAHQVIKNWVDILDGYEAGNHNGTWNKDQIKQNRDSLQGFKTKASSDPNSYEGKLVDKWRSKIDEVIGALNVLLDENRGPNPNPTPQPNPHIPQPDDKNKLPLEVRNKIEEQLASETNPLAKQVWEEVKAMKASDGITLETIEKMKSLLDLIKIAYEGSATGDTLQKLESFSSAKPTSQEGKVWTIAKKVKDDKGKIWVEQVLALTKVRNKLLNVIGNEQIYQRIVESIKNNIQVIEQATNIYSWAQQAHAITGTDETSEVKDLKSKLETAQNHTEAWNAVNNYKENSGDEDGYATKAYKKIASFSKKRQEFIEKSHLAEAKTVAELNQIFQKMKENEKYTGNLKETIEKKSFPRAEIISAIREKNDSATTEEKNLIELIKDFVIKAEIDTDFGNDLDKKTYQFLKSKKEGLEKYAVNDTEQNKVFQSLSAEQQKTISLLISEITEKVNKMEKAIQAEKKNNGSPNTSPTTPFLETTFGKITIGLIVVVILGLIIWFLRSKVVKRSKNN